MQDNIMKYLSNAVNISRDNLENLKEVIRGIAHAVDQNRDNILEANTIDIKNNNGFEIDFNAINNIFAHVMDENIVYGTVTKASKDKNKIFGKEILSVGTVVSITDGNTYTVLELILRNILAGNANILVTSGYMYGVNNLLVTIVQSVLESFDLSKNFVQIFITETYEEVLKHYASIDLVTVVGSGMLQREVLTLCKNRVIVSGYENYDIYIEDKTHLDFINSIISSKAKVKLYVNKALELDRADSILVEDVMEAAAQINYNGSRYSVAIFTNDRVNASMFTKEIKAKQVLVNTSPMISRILDIKQLDLVIEKTIVYPNEFIFDGNKTEVEI